MFFLLLLILIFIVLAIIFVTSTIEIQVKDLEINIPKIKGKIVNRDFKINLKLYFLKKIKILDIDIDKIKLEKTSIKNELKKIRTKIVEDKDNFDLEFLKIIKDINVDFKEMDLRIYLGLEDAALTALLNGIISGILGILLRNKIQNIEKQKYIVNPIYQSRNIINIEIYGIFAVNMWNIINIISKLIKDRRVKKNVRTSNRRAYAYSNE